MHICGGYVFNRIGLDVVYLALTIEIVSVIVMYMVTIEFRCCSAVQLIVIVVVI